MPVDDAACQVALKELAARTQGIASKIVLQSATIFETQGREKVGQAARVRTGTLRRSWHTERIAANAARVGPTVVYARRIDCGFAPGIPPQQGIDKLGRKFKQQPKPYFRSAYENSTSLIYKRATSIVKEELGVFYIAG
jgi:hypothetical protein